MMGRHLPVLLALLLAGCGSCKQAADSDGSAGIGRTSEGLARQGRIGSSAQMGAATKGRVAVPTLSGRAQFPATPELPPMAPAAAGKSLQEEPPSGGDCLVIIDADPDFGEPPLAVSFSVQSRCSGGVPSYTWDFGDGSLPSSDPAPVHVYEAPGEYTASLQAVAPDGVRTADDIDITVEENFLP